MAEQSNVPVRPWQSDIATRTSSSRSTFSASRRNAPSLTGVADLEKACGFRWCATMPVTCARDIVTADRLNVQAPSSAAVGATPACS